MQIKKVMRFRNEHLRVSISNLDSTQTFRRGTVSTVKYKNFNQSIKNKYINFKSRIRIYLHIFDVNFLYKPIIGYEVSGSDMDPVK